MRKMGATAAALVTAQASCLSARAQTVAQTLALDDNAGGYAMATLLCQPSSCFGRSLPFGA
jgi:hypothetical protein